MQAMQRGLSMQILLLSIAAGSSPALGSEERDMLEITVAFAILAFGCSVVGIWHGRREYARGARAGLAVNARLIAQLEAENEQLRCGDLVPFLDEELEEDYERNRKFREHLRRCTDCQGQLPGHLQLGATLARISQPRESRRRGE